MDKKQRIRLRNALGSVYRQKEKAEVEGLWLEGVMDRVRRMGPRYETEAFLERFERFVWRLVPVMALLVLVLAAAITQLNFVPEYEIAQLFGEDPSDFGLIAMLQ